MVMDREMTRTTLPANANTNGSQNGSGESVPEKVNPQTVGREFVRQYYTLLHEAPNYLYRFYSNNSSFIHGGVNGDESPVTGQANIHQRINELNFRDCRAKILHVDAQSSVSDGVVIQVTGELSNNGEAMRRFMQTFVLVPLSSKNYYVHNDIFRYADEVYGDAVNGANGRSGSTSGIDQSAQVHGDSAGPVAFAVPAVVPATVPLVPAAVPTPVSEPVTAPASQSAPVETPAAPATTAPAAVAPSKSVDNAPPASSPVVENSTDSPNKQAVPHTAPHGKHANAGRRTQPAAPQSQAQPAEPAKPKTWASLVHTGGNGKAEPSEPKPRTQAQAHTQSASPSPQTASAAPAPAPAPASAPTPTATATATATTAATTATTATTTAPTTEKAQDPAWEQDSQQVFVGSIPALVTEQVLRERISERYGVKVLGWRWIREVERGFRCGILLLDSDESASKLINSQRPHVLHDDVHINFEVKRDYRARAPNPRRFPSYNRPPPASAHADFPERAERAERGPAVPRNPARGAKRT